jgi:membrane associated rhomboid family serine protease
MQFFALAHSLSHAMSAVSINDHSLSVLAALVGTLGGWAVTGLLQPKARKVKVERKDRQGRRS